MTSRLHCRTAAFFALLLFAAHPAAAELSYNYGELHYISTEIDANGGDVDGDGFGFNGSFELAENVHVFGGYQSIEFDFDADVSAFAIGAGYMLPIAAETDFVARLAYIDGEVETPFGDADDSGLGISAGFRRMFTSEIEGRAFINHVDLDDSGTETSFAIAGDYFFNPQVAAGLGFEFGDDTTTFSIGGRYYFGRVGR